MSPIDYLKLNNQNCFDFNNVSDLIKCLTIILYFNFLFMNLFFFDDFFTISTNLTIFFKYLTIFCFIFLAAMPKCNNPKTVDSKFAFKASFNNTFILFA